MTVFEAFPNAIETGWQIIPIAYSTVTGNYIDRENASDISVIVDEGNSSDANPAPNTASITADMLIYTRPSELPTTNTSALVAGYAISDATKLYEIIDAGIGKNQNNGRIEHVELRIRQTGASNV